MYQRYHIITPFTFWDMHAGDMENVCFLLLAAVGSERVYVSFLVF